MEKHKLIEMGTLSRGKSQHRPRNDLKLYGGKYPFIQTGDVKNSNLYIDKYSQTYNDFGLKQSKLWPENTLCITIAANIADTGILSFPACFPDSIIGFTATKGKTDVRYVKYCFDLYQKSIQNMSKGSTQDNLSMEKLEQLEFNCPSFDDQQKIAAVLSSLDDKIALNNRINAKLEQMAKRLYDYWFVQFDFPGADGKPYKSNGGKMVWNEELKREIPEGWEVKNFGEILILLKDGTHNPPKRQEKGIPLLTGTMFGMNFLDYDKATYISEADYKIIHSQYEPKENDVIITKIGTLGNVNLLRKIDIPIAIHCNSALLRFDMALGVYYPFYYCKSDLFKMRVKAIKGQSIQEFASLDRISSIKSEVPCVDIINKFDKVVKPIIEKQKSISFENEKLKEMRDKLLPLLMNGQV
ncbi:MAG: restriction endonuclease subunit S, partial [Treponema sp.]|nr:restriction endonuclease subunit S [Treponema sp.]